MAQSRCCCYVPVDRPCAAIVPMETQSARCRHLDTAANPMTGPYSFSAAKGHCRFGRISPLVSARHTVAPGGPLSPTGQTDFGVPMVAAIRLSAHITSRPALTQSALLDPLRPPHSGGRPSGFRCPNDVAWLTGEASSSKSLTRCGTRGSDKPPAVRWSRRAVRRDR